MRRLLLLLALAGATLADSWAPFKDRVFKSPNGKHALDARAVRAEKPFRFVLRADGKDVAKGALAHLPYDVHVLDGAPAAILFETYGQIGHGHALARLDRGGTFAWTVTLAQLFDENIRNTFPATVGSIWWIRAWWVDEPRGKVVVASNKFHFREVDLATGEVKAVDERVLLPAMKLPWARRRALELAVRDVPHGLRPVAEKLAADESLPGAERFRAAIAARAAGSEREIPAALWEAAVAAAKTSEERRFVLGQVARFREDALDYLSELALRGDVSVQAVTALAAMGDDAARALTFVVAHGDVDPRTRGAAAQHLGRLSAEPALKAILRELKDADTNAAAALLSAAVATGAPDLDDRLMKHEDTLLKVLDRQKGPLAWLADYFQGRPTSEAVKGLVRALAKHRKQPVLRGKLIAALKSCTGYDLGDDPAAWIKALRGR